MMAFALGELADLLHEGKRFPEIAESKRALDAAVVIAQLPIRSLALEAQGFIARKRRHATATRRAGFLREGLGHVAISNVTNKRRAVSDRSLRTRCRASRGSPTHRPAYARGSRNPSPANGRTTALGSCTCRAGWCRPPPGRRRTRPWAPRPRHRPRPRARDGPRCRA